MIMYTSQVVDVKAKNWSDEPFFVYEVLLPSVFGGRVWQKVPRHRMSEKNRQISLLGGKIITILPLTSQSYDGQSHLAWWVKITTYQPRCLYFFGPFTKYLNKIICIFTLGLYYLLPLASCLPNTKC